MAEEEFTSTYMVPAGGSAGSEDASATNSNGASDSEEGENNSSAPDTRTDKPVLIAGEKKTNPWSLIYIMEAHAADTWRMGQPRDVNQHTCMEDRFREAKQFRTDLSFNKIPMFVDEWCTPCGNPAHGVRCGSPCFERLYGAWPTRVFIFDQNGRMIMKGMPNKAEVDMEQLAQRLQQEFAMPQNCC